MGAFREVFIASVPRRLYREQFRTFGRLLEAMALDFRPIPAEEESFPARRDLIAAAADLRAALEALANVLRWNPE